MFDTHCHLNFGAFDGSVEKVIDQARRFGVNRIVIPGTDIPTSEKAIAIAEKYEGTWAAVGIHPHHVFELLNQKSKIKNQKLYLQVQREKSLIRKKPRDIHNKIT